MLDLVRACALQEEMRDGQYGLEAEAKQMPWRRPREKQQRERLLRRPWAWLSGLLGRSHNRKERQPARQPLSF